MFEDELLQAILNGDDDVEEKGEKHKELFYKKIFANDNSEVFDVFKKDLDKVLIREKEKERKEDTIKKNQEAAEHKAMKDKENVVYVPLTCELSLSISGMIDDDFESSTNILGVFTDPKMAERQCETDINCNDDDWKELKGLPPYNEEAHYVYKVYKSKYFFNREFMVLEVKYRIILKMRLNDFNTSLVLSSSELMDQDTYDMLLNIFENFKVDYDKFLIDVESNIDNVLEERKCKCCENKGEE